MTGNLAVTLKCMDVSHVHTTTFYFHGTNRNRSRSNNVDVHVTVGAVLQLFGSDCIFVRCADEKRAEVASIMRVGHANRRRGTELSHKWPPASYESDQVMRGKSQNRILYRFFRKRCIGFRVASDLFSRIPMQGQTDRATLVKSNGVPICNCERRAIRPAICAANGSLTNSLNARFRIQCSATRTTARYIGISQKSPAHHLVVAGRSCERSNDNVFDAYSNGVAYLGPCNGHRSGTLMAASNCGSNHRSPASRCSVCHDMPAVSDGSEHGQGW